MEPLKITAKLLTGQVVTADLWLPLDSILAYAWMMEHHPDKLAASTSGMRPEDILEPELPLERRGEGDDWYWACSFALGSPRGQQIVYYHRRFDAQESEAYVDFGKRRGKVNHKAGPYRSCRVPLMVVLVPELVWYAVGNRYEVEWLLQYITHIGKKRSQGYGRVARWTVERAEEDLSSLRPIPDPEGDFEMGVRPPYWMRDNWRRVRMPNDDRLLCRGELCRIGS